MNLKLAIVLCTVCLSCLSGVYSVPQALLELSPHIVGGVSVESNSIYPWIASFRQDTSSPFCTGSLISISPPVVLTAAHCVGNLRWDELADSWKQKSLYLSSVNIYVDVGRLYPLEAVSTDNYIVLSLDSSSRIAMHPEYAPLSKKTYVNDVALIMFARNRDLESSGIWVPTLAAQLPVGKVCCTERDTFTVVGYGRSTDSDAVMLQKSTQFYITEGECIDYYGGNRLSLSNAMLCTQSEDSGTCGVDAGGPVLSGDDILDLELTGVTSFGKCAIGAADAASSVAHYRTWIDKKMHGFVADTATAESMDDRLVDMNMQAHWFTGSGGIMLMLVNENVWIMVSIMVVIAVCCVLGRRYRRRFRKRNSDLYQRIPDWDEEAGCTP